MKKTKLLSMMVILALVMALFIGCQGSPVDKAGEGDGGQGAAVPQEEQVELIISAAASLKDTMEEIGQIYEEKHDNTTLTFTFDGSGTLQQQIEQGAPVDVFLSAALKQMNALKEKDLLQNDTIIELLENKVVLITPKDGENINDFKDLTEDSIKKIAFGEPSSVPVGQYTEEITNFLGIKEAIQPKVVYAKNVREVLTWVETGNADVGVVYATDAQISDKIVVRAEAPADSHKPVIYPAAVIKSSEEQEEAKAFLEFLKNDEAKAVFEKHGFSMID